MLYVLDHEFFIHSESIARALVGHLHGLGFLDVSGETRAYLNTRLISSRGDTRFDFHVPFGIDHSYDVETLFAAIEGCLEETNLSLNEFALLLLTRRAWPSGLSTSYALRRLAFAVVKWITSKVNCVCWVKRHHYLTPR